MQELGRWCLLFNPEESNTDRGEIHRRYVPRMPAGLDPLYKIVPIVILSSIKCPVAQREFK